MADQSVSGVVPLLNEYKYSLLRRRTLQLLTGGAIVRKAPWFIHMIQLCLWVAPLLLYIPFLIVDALGVWDPYFITLVYALSMGLYSLLLEALICCIQYCKGGCSAFMSANRHLDDEQDHDLTFSSCFDRSTIDFIFGKKKLHSLILHPIVDGLLSYSGGFLLLPTVMQETLHTAAVVIVFIIGWYTQCNAHYSLSVNVPNEVAVYRVTDPLELRYLMRPFYIAVVAATFIVIRLLVVDPSLYMQVLYAVFCLLPLGWSVGVLPPLDGLVVWLMEQGLVRLLGASAMGTELRLSIMFLLSLCSVVIVSAVTDHTLTVSLSAVFGFILSQDIFSIFSQFMWTILSLCKLSPRSLKYLYNRLPDKVFISFIGVDCRNSSSIKVHLLHLVCAFFKGVILLAISIVVLYFTFTTADSSAKDLALLVLGGTVLGSFVIIGVSNSLQKVYVLRVIRNPFFPWTCDNIDKFKYRRKLLRYFSIPRTITCNLVLSLLLFAYVGLGLRSEVHFAPPIWLGISVSRIIRKIWQNAASAHLELSLVALLDFIIPSTTIWSIVGLATQSLILGEIFGILNEFLQKLFFASSLFISFITNRKQKTHTWLTVVIIVGTILLLPLVLIVLFVSSIVSAPLLPLFTLPVFTISFPRPKTFWPGLLDFGQSYTKCEDSVYYEQCQSEIVKAIHSSMSAGSVCSQPGTQVLVRFDDRIIICTVLEVGFGFRTLVLKGLELQETSCHTVEASRIDDIFDMVYKSSSCCSFIVNTHFGNSLQAKDSAVIRTYSDARNVLTGIIDQRSSLEKFSSNLHKTLTWVFFHHYKRCCQSKHTTLPPRDEEPIDGNVKKNISQIRNDMMGNDSSNRVGHESTGIEECINKHVEDDVNSWDSISSVDGDSPANSLPLNSVRFLPAEVSTDLRLSSPGNDYKTTAGHNCPENIFVSPVEINLPSIPVSESTIRNSVMEQTLGPAGASVKVHPVEELSQIPSRWSNVPLSSKQVDKIVTKFSSEWLTFVKESSFKGDSSRNFDGLNTEQEQQLIRLVAACFSLIDVPTVSSFEGIARETNSFDVYQGFNGDFQFSTHLHWLTGDNLLHKLVLQAYRYAVKLLYDEASLGDVEDHVELTEYLESYDSDFFIGSEVESGWADSILKQVSHLFSISRNTEENVYTAHVLTLQDQVIHIGEVNSEAVKGIWADLSLELLFLTNDDEERYSIQAHPLTLRNLMIQSANPPFGYCVYSSGLLSISS